MVVSEMSLSVLVERKRLFGDVQAVASSAEPSVGCVSPTEVGDLCEERRAG